MVHDLGNHRNSVLITELLGLRLHRITQLKVLHLDRVLRHIYHREIVHDFDQVCEVELAILEVC